MRDNSRNLPMALLRAREAVMARFRPLLRAHGLTEQQWRVLRALAEAEHLEATRLSAQTLISMPSLSRVLRGLEAGGLIARANVEGDNRRRRIRLSPAGREMFDTIAPLSEAEYRRIEDAIGADVLDTLYAGLTKLEG